MWCKAVIGKGRQKKTVSVITDGTIFFSQALCTQYWSRASDSMLHHLTLALTRAFTAFTCTWSHRKAISTLIFCRKSLLLLIYKLYRLLGFLSTGRVCLQFQAG